jgi:hypothetical protein
LPASPCLRVRLIYSDDAGNEAGSRFYLSYAGAAPTAATLDTLASDIAGLFNTDLWQYVNQVWTFTEVDILDIATDAGASGTWSGSHSGGNTGAIISANAAINVEYLIARRYRGGKPRMYLPPASDAQMLNSAKWEPSFTASVQTSFATFMTAVEALTPGTLTALTHVNLSYYKGFVNVENSSGRERAAPTYRSSALLDTVTGYSVKQVIGSQRRRRTSTTP